MPGGDRRGPAGFGPMSGRRMGYCAGYEVPGFANWGPGRGGGFGYGRGMGRGFGAGRGFGRGYGRGFAAYDLPVAAPYSEASEKTFIQNEINVLKEQLESFEARLSELNKEEK